MTQDTRLPLTDAEADAFRAYMHDLDRQAAIDMGEDPDAICPQCGYVTGDDPIYDTQHNEEHPR